MLNRVRLFHSLIHLTMKTFQSVHLVISIERLGFAFIKGTCKTFFKGTERGERR